MLYFCYTRGVILLSPRPNTQCYIQAYNVWITEEYTRYTDPYYNAFYTVTGHVSSLFGEVDEADGTPRTRRRTHCHEYFQPFGAFWYNQLQPFSDQSPVFYILSLIRPPSTVSYSPLLKY